MARLSPIPPQSAAAVVIPDHRPFYRIKAGKFFGPDDTLYEEGAIIGWDEEPNLEMEPLNQKAHSNMIEFLKKLDKAGKEAAEKAGKAYNSLADAHANAYALAQQDSKRVEVLSGKKQIPLMMAKKNVPSIEKLDANKHVPLMGNAGKAPLRNESVTVDG